MKPTITIDGDAFSDLAGFFSHFETQALDAGTWGRNLDAFNDVLRGGFGTPEGGFIILWKNHALSKARLGYKETQRVLEARLTTCHPANRGHVSQDLRLAQDHQGPTVFDWVVEIIRVHCTGGSEEEDGVELVLQ